MYSCTSVEGLGVGGADAIAVGPPDSYLNLTKSCYCAVFFATSKYPIFRAFDLDIKKQLVEIKHQL